MPGRVTPLINENYYHIYNRGANKQPIFRGIRDYRRIIEIIKFYQYNHPPIRYSKYLQLPSERRKIISLELFKQPRLVWINAYCLMPNHFHFLLKQNITNGISSFIGNLQNSYTRYFNIKYAASGPLFQGQFKSVYVEDNNQLLHLNRYIHLNPSSSFIVKDLDSLLKYPWSSLQEYLDVSADKVCDKDITLTQFKNIECYKSFVLDQADYQRRLDIIKHLTID